MEFNPIGRLDAKTSPAVLEKARRLYGRDSLNIRLKALREKYGVRQTDVANFTQTAVSKLEGRRDMRISTLIDYLESLGMGLEISALPGRGAEREVLLRVKSGEGTGYRDYGGAYGSVYGKAYDAAYGEAYGEAEESLVAETPPPYRAG